MAAPTQTAPSAGVKSRADPPDNHELSPMLARISVRDEAKAIAALDQEGYDDEAALNKLDEKGLDDLMDKLKEFGVIGGDRTKIRNHLMETYPVFPTCTMFTALLKRRV